jgi:hypothetical protein
MSDYTKLTNFAVKDGYTTGNPAKVIKGTEIDDEFNAIATAIATKYDATDLSSISSSIVPTAVAAALTAAYPVGSVYINATNSTNPGTLLGFGTWIAFGAGRVPVGFDSTNSLFDAAEETGGSYNAIVVSHTHTGTTASSGNHNHTYDTFSGSGEGSAAQGGFAVNTGTTSTAGAHTHTFTTDSTGSSGTNANIQPYITVYMWKRTA